MLDPIVAVEPRVAPHPLPSSGGRSGSLVKVALTVVFMTIAFRQVGPRELLDLIRGMQSGAAGLLGAAISLSIGMALINTAKWRLLLQAVGVRLPWGRAVVHYFVGYFLNNILTGMGEVRRVYAVGRETGATPAAFVSVLLERWSGIGAQAALSLVGLALATTRLPQLRGLAVANAVALAVMVGLYVAAVRGGARRGGGAPSPFVMGGAGDPATPSQRVTGALGTQYGAPAPHYVPNAPITRWLAEAHSALLGVRDRERAVGVACALSAVVALLLVAVHLCLARALGVQTSQWSFALLVPAAVAFGQAPISVNGLGIQEVAYIALFRLTGLSPAQALAISVLAHGVKLAVGCLGGIMGLVKPDLDVQGNSTSRRSGPT